MIDEKYSFTKELGTEILMAITSFLIAFVVFVSVDPENAATLFGRNPKIVHIFLSSAYALFLPLMSYMFAQVQQYYPEGRAQVILVWMVLMELIRVYNERFPTWELRKNLEQMVRLSWVGFLIFGYARPNGLRADLIILCVYCAIFEVMKGYFLGKAKNSNLIGQNPTLIHNYMKNILIKQNDLHTTPMNNCDYIVLGEQNHNITFCHNGYLLGEKKSGTEGILTVGKVFQINSPEVEALTSEHPFWRDTCLAFALAKMLRRRFAKLPLYEEGCKKALDFVLEGLIGYIGTNDDNKTNGSNGKIKRDPKLRVFYIIKEELRFVSDILHVKVPYYHYNDEQYACLNCSGYIITLSSGIYLSYIVSKRIVTWSTIEPQDAHDHCFLNTFRHGSRVVRNLSRLDLAITILLVIACIYISVAEFMKNVQREALRLGKIKRDGWVVISSVKMMWYNNRKTKKKLSFAQPGNTDRGHRFYSSVLDMKGETIFYIKVDWLFRGFCPKWIRRIFLRLAPTVYCSTEALGAILSSLRNSGGHLTNGETSLKLHRMENLIYACKPNESTTEAILIWHVATFLFHHLISQDQQNEDKPKEEIVALNLSCYCCYLVADYPELLPDEVNWTKNMYESVIKEILAIDRKLDEKPSRKKRCNYALQVMNWEENPVLGKGVKLAKELVDSAGNNAAPVWTMLADFWAEVMLFIAPSDNVEGHKKILHREELITQLWALLTHAGILRRPQPTEHHDDQMSEINDVIGEANV